MLLINWTQPSGQSEHWVFFSDLLKKYWFSCKITVTFEEIIDSVVR